MLMQNEFKFFRESLKYRKGTRPFKDKYCFKYMPFSLSNFHFHFHEKIEFQFGSIFNKNLSLHPSLDHDVTMSETAGVHKNSVVNLNAKANSE